MVNSFLWNISVDIPLLLLLLLLLLFQITNCHYLCAILYYFIVSSYIYCQLCCFIIDNSEHIASVCVFRGGGEQMQDTDFDITLLSRKVKYLKRKHS